MSCWFDTRICDKQKTTDHVYCISQVKNIRVLIHILTYLIVVDSLCPCYIWTFPILWGLFPLLTPSEGVAHAELVTLPSVKQAGGRSSSSWRLIAFTLSTARCLFSICVWLLISILSVRRSHWRGFPTL